MKLPTPQMSVTPQYGVTKKSARTIEDRDIRNHPLTLYQACLEGERSELNRPVFFYDHIE